MSERAVQADANVPLAPLTTLGVGGAARWLVRAACADDVAAVHRWAGAAGLPVLVLGGGSNVVLSDEGWNGVVLHVMIRGLESRTTRDETFLRAGAGEPWDAFVAHAVRLGLAGLECLSGIPGYVGGTPIQNVGAYGQEVRTSIVEVTAWDRIASALVTLPADACGFGYRTSRFKREDAGRFVVCDITFGLRRGAPTVTYPDLVAHIKAAGIAAPTLDDVRGAVLMVRRSKGMVLDPADPDTRSVGSFFTNPVVARDVWERIAVSTGSAPPAFDAGGDQVKLPAAWLIQHSGFDRTATEGGAALSSKHPLAIVNRGGATALDVLRLAAQIKRRVIDCFGVSLRPEPVFVGFAPDPDLDYLEPLTTA